MIYYYGRVSTDHQENSAANQRQVFEGLAAEHGQPHMILIDKDVSGTVPLKERPEGKVLWDLVSPGDTVVTAKLDRAFRNVGDAANCLGVWRPLGVKLKILDFPVDISTDEGELMFLTIANIAQYENRLRGRRVREVYEYRKRNNLPYSKTRPFGWVRDGDKWAVLHKERQIADMLAEWVADGCTYRGAASKLCLKNIPKPVARPSKRNRTARCWYDSQDVKCLLLARANGYPTISQVQMRDALRDGTLASKGSNAPQTNT